MCDLKGCEREGRNVLQVVFVIRDKERTGRKKWTIPATTGLRICDECKRHVMVPQDVLADDGARIEKGLLAMRPGATIVSRRLAWTTIDSEDYKRLQGMQPS